MGAEATYPTDGPVTLRTNLGDYPWSHALIAGDIRSDLLRWDFRTTSPVTKGFASMVRDRAFDAGELPIVTSCQALHFGKPVVLLPAVTVGRFAHGAIVYNPERGRLGPSDLAGRRVGMRSYTVTTALWVRGILQDEYGLDLDDVTWVTTEGGNIEEYRDPENVERAEGASLEAMLLDGTIDAAILGGAAPPAPLAPLIPEPKAAARAWFEKHRIVPINHLFAVDEALARQRPDVLPEIYRVLRESKRAAPAEEIDMCPFGIEENRPALGLALRYMAEQRLVPRPFSVDELFGAWEGLGQP